MSKQLVIMVGMCVVLVLQGCMATKLVTVPVKVAYGTTKVVVKGTSAAVGAVIPDGDEDTAD